MFTTSAAEPKQPARHIDALVRAAAEGEPSEVEVALGRFRGDAATAAAKQAAASALAAERWGNLSYLADFLADTTAAHPPTGGADSGDGYGCGADEEAEAVVVPPDVLEKGIFECVVSVTGRRPGEISPAEVSEADRDKIADCVVSQIRGIMEHVTSTPHGAEAEPPSLSKLKSSQGLHTRKTMEKKASHETPSILGDVVPKAQAPIAFEIVDEEAPAGEYGSAEDPSPYIHLADPAEDLEGMKGADDRVIDRSSIQVLYSYPLGTTGPSALEKTLDGWVFEETAPAGFFTRADLVRAIASRYKAIYAEEEATTQVEPHFIPGMLNRAPSNGKYAIWGHVLDDLLLHTVTYEPEHDVYTLGIDS